MGNEEGEMGKQRRISHYGLHYLARPCGNRFAPERQKSAEWILKSIRGPGERKKENHKWKEKKKVKKKQINKTVNEKEERRKKEKE